MIKGRIWRWLLFLLLLYVTFVIIFLRSSDEITTTSPLPHARVIVDDNREIQQNIPVQHVEDDKNVQSNLEPVMTKGVLGNYELKNLVKPSGPGEDGEGVQLQGEEEKKLGEKSVAEYGFNEVASEKISLDRRARDTRYQNKERIKFTEEIYFI